MFYFYILKSLKSSKYYVGSTNDIEARLELHNLGRVQSTKYDKPWELIYKKSFINLKETRKRELQVKHWKSRKAIERLIKTF